VRGRGRARLASARKPSGSRPDSAGRSQRPTCSTCPPSPTRARASTERSASARRPPPDRQTEGPVTPRILLFHFLVEAHEKRMGGSGAPEARASGFAGEVRCRLACHHREQPLPLLPCTFAYKEYTRKEPVVFRSLPSHIGVTTVTGRRREAHAHLHDKDQKGELREPLRCVRATVVLLIPGQPQAAGAGVYPVCAGRRGHCFSWARGCSAGGQPAGWRLGCEQFPGQGTGHVPYVPQHDALLVPPQRWGCLVLRRIRIGGFP
jgi:hypothetical protein